MLHVLKSHSGKKVIPSAYSDVVTKQDFNAIVAVTIGNLQA
jgi:hypothetical protein